MRAKLPEILVTGGAGFIGSEFIRQAVSRGEKAAVVDKLTYAGDLKRLEPVKGRYEFFRADICDRKFINAIFNEVRPRAVVHFAAETHVDRSIVDSFSFIRTNFEGTQALLEASRKFKVRRFLHVSTDEVYGEIKRGRFSEASPLEPSSPYAASKAAGDLLVRAYARTYGFPAIVVRPCNNYGPWQYPEKLIPLAITRALSNRKVPVFLKGRQVREWLYVADCAEAIMMVLRKGRLGEVYNIGSGERRVNINVVKGILNLLDKPEALIEFVKDRPGHDFRYALRSAKIKQELGWEAKTRFSQGLKATVEWYVENNYKGSSHAK